MTSAILLSLLVSKTELWKLFPKEADVTVTAPGLVRLPLSEDVLRESKGDLADVRLFDANNKEIVYVIDSGETVLDTKSSVKLELKKIQRSTEPQGDAPALYHEAFDTSAPPDGDWTIVFDTAAPEIVRRVKITGVGRDGVPVPLATDVSLFRLPHMGAERLTVPVTIKGYTRLVIAIDGEAAGYMQPKLSAVQRALYGGTASLRVPLTKLSELDRGKRTVATFARPAGIVPSSVLLETTDELFDRTVHVIDDGKSLHEAIGAARLFRIKGFVDVLANEVLTQRARGDKLVIEIEDGDSPPLLSLGATALVRQPVLVFNAPATKVTLRYGGGRVERAQYDVTGLLPPAGTTLGEQRTKGAVQLLTTKLATLAAPRLNPSFDTRPALAFAMRAGAPVEVAQFTHRASLPLQPSSDGLAAIVLPSSVTAVARPDFGDVRIVDKKAQQWPYLVDEEPSTELRPLQIRMDTNEHTTRVTLSDDFAPMRIDRIELDVDAPYLDRAVSVLAVDKNGTEKKLMETRLVRRQGQDTPLAIDLTPAAVHAIILVVQNGDDAPLSLNNATARHQRRKLFVAASGGDYVLLVGSPDLSAPSYELAAVRDTVLAVSASETEPPTLVKNPDYRVTANLGSGQQGLQLALWVIIGVAVLVLGALTLRLAKQS